MPRLAALLGLLALTACANTTSVASLGLSFGSGGMRVVPSVGVSGSNASLVFHP